MYIIWIVPGHNKQRQQTSFFVMTKHFFAKTYLKNLVKLTGSAFSSSFASFQTRYLLLWRGNDCNFLWLKSGKVDFLTLSDGEQTCICFTVLFYINGKSQKLIESSNRMSEGKITSRINSSQLKKHLKNIIPIDYVFLNNNKNFRVENFLKIMLKVWSLNTISREKVLIYW